MSVVFFDSATDRPALYALPVRKDFRKARLSPEHPVSDGNVLYMAVFDDNRIDADAWRTSLSYIASHGDLLVRSGKKRIVFPDMGKDLSEMIGSELGSTGLDIVVFGKDRR